MSVFGALNRFISRLDDAPRPQSAGSDGSFGFQVLRNTNNEIPLEPWFDFIVGINGRQIENPDPNLFANEVRNCAGTSVLLALWNAKGQRHRELYLPIPPLPTPTSPLSLALTLQWTPLASVSLSTWHILEVAPNSPADDASLLPYGDYIIGSPEGVLRGEAALGELVEEYLSRPLRLYVYNHEYNVTRTVTITPSRSWGGEGALGCVLGFGHLHQIPAPLEEGPPTGVGETMFEGAPGRVTPPSGEPGSQQGQDDLSQFAMSPPKGDVDSGSAAAGFQGAGSANLLTPANMPTAPPLLSPNSAVGGKGGKSGAKKGARPGRSNAGFDEMFAEGEKKSVEAEGGGGAEKKGKGAGGVPPPPRAGAGAGGNSPGGLRPETRSPDPITGESDDGSGQ